MPKFYFIDESLCDVGGHHYGFARLTLEAAAQFGYEVVLASHRSFAEAISLSATSRILRLYPHRLYDDPCLMPCGESSGHGIHAAANWIERGRRWRHAARRRRWIADHAAATRLLFEQVPPRRGDQVFFAAAAEATLNSLAALAATGALAACLDYHLLFHFNPFAGTPPDYPRQSLRRRCFASAFARIEKAIPAKRLHYYATTDELTNQFEFISPKRVTTLGYPLDPAMGQINRAQRDGQRLRIAFAGDARLEKGFHHLPAIVDALRPELTALRAQFVLQSNFPFRLPCRRRNQPLVAARDHLARYPHQQVALLCEPLDPKAYQSLIAKADIAVLPYDPVHYHARCSGVLLEMLAAGVPVVVPAGGWMARQVEASGAGRVASSIDDFPRVIREVIADYERFAHAARSCSSDLLRSRHPRRFMADLLSHSTELAPQPRSHAA
jgi:glycosyltransferase involved in cell wall biosynthesis